MPTKKQSAQKRLKLREQKKKEFLRKEKKAQIKSEKEKEWLYEQATVEWATVRSKMGNVPTLHKAGHSQPHRPIFSLGGTNLHHTGTDKPWCQHGYAFVPNFKQLMDDEESKNSRALTYIRPSDRDREARTINEEQRIYYVTKEKTAGKTHASQEDIDALFDGLKKKKEGKGADSVLQESLQRQASQRTQSVADCLICMTVDLEDPWISSCGHICCSDCWMTWLDENNPAQCPQCDANVTQEDLQPVVICCLCNREPADIQSPPCGHGGCYKCWRREIDGGLMECPTCGESVSMAEILSAKQITPRTVRKKPTTLFVLGGDNNSDNSSDDGAENASSPPKRVSNITIEH